MDQTGSFWICTGAGSPGTWVNPSGSGAFVPLSTVTTKGDLIVGTAASTVSRLGVGTNNFVLVADSTQPTGIKWAAVTSVGSVATDPIWTTKGQLAVATGSAAAAALNVGSDGQLLVADSTQPDGIKWATVPVGSVPAGSSLLVYRYTVTGSPKASIDTGVDTPNAGSNDWTNGDLLEIHLYSRTDEVVALSAVNVTFNNDAGANQYVYERFRASNTTLAGAASGGSTSIQVLVAGASTLANVFTNSRMSVPAYAATVGLKTVEMTAGHADTNTGQAEFNAWAAVYRSTSALTRAAFAPNTVGKNFVVGTELLIYKRTAS